MEKERAMVPSLPNARAVARRLLDQSDATIGSQVLAADHVYRDLAVVLSRSFGPLGYHALLARALAQVRSSYPALGAISVHSPIEPWLEGLDAAERAHGAGATIDGVTAVLSAFVDLLARLIGEDMAISLLSQALPDHAQTAGGHRDRRIGA